MKTKTLFDHIKQITNVQNQLYWDNITDADKKELEQLYGSQILINESRVDRSCK